MDHVYIIPGFKISELNEIFLQRHGGSAVPALPHHGAAHGPADIETRKLRATNISTGMALFTEPEAGETEVQTWIIARETSLYTSCTCGAPSGKLCPHQARALLAISRQGELRVHFDAGLRHQQLSSFAVPYGLEKEKDLDQYFRVDYANGVNTIKTVNPNLVPLTREHILKLQDSISAAQERPSKLTTITGNTASERLPLIVFKQHKYYKQLMIELAEAAIAQNGKPKNPVLTGNAVEMIWKASSPAEAKFFSAIHFFQQRAPGNKPVEAIRALKALFKNPGGFPFYRHDASISANLTAASLRPLETGGVIRELQLRVVKVGAFYQINAEVEAGDQKYPLGDFSLRYDYFLTRNKVLYLAGNAKVLEAVKFLKQHDDRLLVHESKYIRFREEMLSLLEDDNRVDYAHLPPASLRELREHRLDTTPEKLLYLNSFGPYVELKPVMKYGEIEIPILSKRNIHPKGIKTPFRVNRDSQAETDYISLLIKQHPYFSEQIEEQLPYFYLHKKHFLDEDWFPEAFDEWQRNEIQVFGFSKLQKLPLNPHKAKVNIRVLSGTDWFNAEITLSYGVQKASIRQLHKAVRNKSKYVRLDDGTLGILPREWIDKFRDYFNAGEPTASGIRIPRSSFRAVSELFESDVMEERAESELTVLETEMTALRSDLDKLKAGLKQFKVLKESAVPARLDAKLRDYQRQGLSWLNFLDEHKFGGCLADEMGLGKTLQIIAFILHQQEKRGHNTSLLLVPTSLVFNWMQEIGRFAPSLKVLSHYGPERTCSTSRFKAHELVITTYGTLLSDITFLKDFSFNYVFADESQQIKNPDSQRYRAACLLKSRNRIAITGTPLENNTFDLYGQLSFACPGLLGNRQYFREIYAIPIDRFEDRKRAAELQEKVRPFILRRTKRQVTPELPEKTEMTLLCDMAPTQQRIYKAVEREFREYICSKTSEELPRNSVHVLKGLTRLRQICNSPLLLNDEEISASESGKVKMLMQQLQGKLERHKILVFSQFVSMLHLVAKELDRREIGYSCLTGSSIDREQIVSRFQEDPSKRIFLISLKAGGNGLNLTQADYVYLIDPWWNPAVENQAIDRAHRIGQKKNVAAIRLICAGTIEEKIMQLQESKKDLFNKVLNKESLLDLIS